MTHFSYGQQLCKRGLFGCHAQRLGDTGSGPGVICRGCLVASSFVVAHLPRRCLQRPLLVTVVPLDWWASLANLVLDSIRGPCPLVHLGEPGRQLREKETVGELCIQQLSQLLRNTDTSSPTNLRRRRLQTTPLRTSGPAPGLTGLTPLGSRYGSDAGRA